MADIPSRRSSIIAQRFTVIGNTFKRAVTDNPRDKIEIEIGDSKQPDFKPQAKISRWDNEVNFSLRAQEHPEAVVRTEGKLIKYVTPDYEVHQYELDPGEIGEDGGLEFEWVLPAKPTSNVLTATIQTKELNFFYQPALTQEEIDDGASRPENVVGSYAVYHKTKGGMNRADGMEYKTGKAFHIYRPKVTDANGYFTWAELNIDEENGLLSVTVPQEFLDKAAYPVIVDPTFGYTTKGGTQSSNTPGTLDLIFCFQCAVPTNGTLDSITHYLKQLGSENPDFEFLVYNDSDNYPTSLLATSTSTWRLTNSWDDWKTLNFSSEPLVTGNYWLSTFTDGSRGSSEDGFYIYYDSISTNRRVSSFDEVTWPTPSDPFPSGKTVATNLKISIYATYTESGGSASPSVSDSSTITESLSADVSDPQITVSDSATITESVGLSVETPAAPDDIDITVSDSSTITESLSVDVSDPQIAVSDSASISESVGVGVSTLDTPQPTVSDTITIAENVGVVVSDPQVVVIDSVSITESVSVIVEAIVDRSIAVSDTTTISENVVTALSDLQIVASESVNVAESVSMLIGYRYKKNDRLNLDIGSGLSIPLGKPLSPSWGSSTRPSSPKIDEYGYNKQTGEWEIYTEEGWKTFQDITISASEPENPKENDLWIDIS